MFSMRVLFVVVVMGWEVVCASAVCGGGNGL
jgi:hypothetical protein